MASEDEWDEGLLSFSPTQIKRILYESQESGIQDETVRKELRKILRIPNLEIDEISRKLQSICFWKRTEMKNWGSRKTVKEERVGANSKQGQDKTMAENLKTLQCQVAAITKLKSEMENLKTAMKTTRKDRIPAK